MKEKSNIKRYGMNRWIVKSNKMRNNVYLYSNIEYLNWLRVEYNSNVKNYIEQHPKIEMTNAEGEKVKSIPDVYIEMLDGTRIIQEVKPEADLEKERVKRQLEIQRTFCEKVGFKHEIITEKNLINNAVLNSNLKLLNKINENSTPYIEEEILKRLASKNPRKVVEIFIEINNHIEEFDHFFVNILSLIKKGTINADIEKTYLGKFTEVSNQ